MLNKCILYNIKKFERELSKIAEEEFKVIDMHHSYGYILSFIEKNEIVKTKDIAKDLNLNSSTVTRMVAKLEKDGYIIKGSPSSPVDIALSPKGIEKMPIVNATWDKFHARLDETYSASQMQIINELIGELLD